jgi:CPA1 family monovalent cation:H+ antiporter
VGYEIPLLVTLLFGAIISATDPVAVLALFKDFGVPHRLTLLFEGESLLNDGTAFAMFLVLLEMITHGYHGFPTILHGVISFATMILGGALFGMLMGLVFSKFIEWVAGHEHLEITLTLLVAHLTFLLAELISETLVIEGHAIHVSSIIATLVSSMVLGNYGRFKMSAGVEEYMGKFWSYFAFLANSLVFLLMGILFSSLVLKSNIGFLPVFLIILVVMVARAMSIYLSVGIANQVTSEENIPIEWQHLMAWGGLRGSLAVIMVLLIPDDLTMPNWTYNYSIKEFLIAITIGSIYFTLLIKAGSLGKLVRRLKIDALLPYEELSYFKSKALIYQNIAVQTEQLYQHQQINKQQHATFVANWQSQLQDVYRQCGEISVDSHHFIENMLRIYTLALQKAELKVMFRRNEINESIYKKNLNILETQTERVEQDRDKLKSLNEYITNRLVLLKDGFRKLFKLSKDQSEAQEHYLYYRTQFKLINKVLQELSNLENSPLIEVFDDRKAIQSVISIYQKLKSKTEKELQYELKSHQEFLDDFNQESAKAQLRTVQNETLKELHQNEIITTKLYALLKKEMNN